jgi:hypothetical protein
MADIIKTIESWRDRGRVLAWLTRRNRTPNQDRYLYYFTLGRGRPKQHVEHLFFTFQGRVIGWFDVEEIVTNLGTWAEFVEDGTTMEESTGRQRAVSVYQDREGKAWKPNPGAWLILCPPPFHLLQEEIFFSGFQGFRYFDLESYRKTFDAKVLL